MKKSFSNIYDLIDKKVSSVNLKKANTILIAITLFLILAHLIARFFFNMDDENGLFNLDVERNIPTVYTTALLVFSGLLLLFIGYKSYRGKKKFIFNWLLLGLIFVYLGFDEYLSIHEKWMEPIRESLNTTGLLYFAWIIPYLVALILLGLLYLKFIFSLPKKTRNRIIIAGCLYVLGALVIEAFGGSYIEKVEWQKDLIYFFIITFEESFEIIGLSFFISSLLYYNQKEMVD